MLHLALFQQMESVYLQKYLFALYFPSIYARKNSLAKIIIFSGIILVL